MNVKLFIVMGMSWIWEVVSFFVTKYLHDENWHHVFFYTTDVFNCLQGVLIFILFVLKSRVYLEIEHQEEEIQPDVQRDHDFAWSW